MNKSESFPIAEYARKLCKAKKSYDFPLVTYDFVADTKCYHPGMLEVEGYIGELLRSGERERIKDGLSNILYWGWARRKGLQRSWVKNFRCKVEVDQLVEFAEIAGSLSGPGLVRLREIELPLFSRMSFVSKIRMFLDPISYPVLDLKIADFAKSERFPPLKCLKAYPKYIPITVHNEKIYGCWASWCRAVAEQVNSEPTAPCKNLRAVDVERAIFQLASCDQTTEAWQLLAGPQDCLYEDGRGDHDGPPNTKGTPKDTRA